MAEYTLHCFAQSGNAYKVALMLALTGADWQARFVDYFGGETRGEAFRKLNPMGEVPVLEHGERVLTQSGVMLDYLAGQTGRFGARSADEGREILRWLLWDNHKLTSYTATYRFLGRFAPGASPEVIAFFGQRARTAWDVLEQQLAGRTFLVGERPTIADLSACGYLYFDDEIGVDWGEFPNVLAWLERIRSLEGWRHPYDLMPGQPVGAT
ncbi:MAG: glutathione S-transferase [Rhizobiales bacterium]|nr:glutathione S-transferase [Hyphomicrobiales bacterium]